MIVGSLLLILVAIALAVLGVAGGSDALLIGSIAASLLAAVALVVGARQNAADRLATVGPDFAEDLDVPLARMERERPNRAEAAEASGRRAESGSLYGGNTSTAVLDVDSDLLIDEDPTPPTIPSQAPAVEDEEPPVPAEPAAFEDEYDDEYDDDDPPDEPPAQYVTPADASRVARLHSDVLVIDGRPRYHLAGCVHLLGRESEPLPVSEAIELGFTPCSLCEPATVLLTDARR